MKTKEKPTKKAERVPMFMKISSDADTKLRKIVAKFGMTKTNVIESLITNAYEDLKDKTPPLGNG